MRNIIAKFSLLLSTAFLFSKCSKDDDFSSAALEDFMNLGIGKYVIYRMDSTLYTNFGQTTTVIKYQAKDEIDGAITDNLGRPGWRVVRYLRDTLGQGSWSPNSTYWIIPTRESVEVIIDNFRYQKLKLPVKDGFTWKGNSFISLYSSDPNWDFRYLDDWDYTYEYVDQPFATFGNIVVDSTITVNQRDELTGVPNDPNFYSERNFSTEIYGKGIGLIYQDFLHWEYQPPTGGNPGYKIGYGIRLNMIQHN